MFREVKEWAKDLQYKQQIQGSEPSLSESRAHALNSSVPPTLRTESNFKPHRPQNNSLLLLSTIKTMG